MNRQQILQIHSRLLPQFILDSDNSKRTKKAPSNHVKLHNSELGNRCDKMQKWILRLQWHISSNISMLDTAATFGINKAYILPIFNNFLCQRKFKYGLQKLALRLLIYQLWHLLGLRACLVGHHCFQSLTHFRC